MKNPPTPGGIEPATFRFVAQHLNHCATAVRQTVVGELKNVELWLRDTGFVFPTALFITHKEQTGTKQTYLKPALAYYHFSPVWSLFCNYMEITPQ